MKKGLLICVLLLLLTGCTRNVERVTAEPPFSGGSGMESDPYRIGTEADLWQMARLINGEETHEAYSGACYLLTADLILDRSREWIPICEFSGTLDGGNHGISGMHMEYSGSLLEGKITQLGFIGKLRGDVKNLTIRDASVVCENENIEVGAVAGNVWKGTIENCHVSDTVQVRGNYLVGGICGNLNGHAAVNACSNGASVTGEGAISAVGGIAGRAAGTVSRCTNTGAVRADGDAGGIACSSSSGIWDCVNTGSVTAEGSAAGIVVSFSDGALNSGMNDPGVELRGCTNSGTVISTGDPAGGIAVSCRTGRVIDCLNSGDVSSPEEVGGILAYFQPSMFGTPAAVFRVEGCTNTGAVTNTDYSFMHPVGGICGRVYDSIAEVRFENCENLGSISSGTSAGGILGDGTVRCLILSGCTNGGAISGAETAGGLVGEIKPTQEETEEEIVFLAENCRNTGTVFGAIAQGFDGGIYVGGILGRSNELIGDRLFDRIEFAACENRGELSGDEASGRVYVYDLCGTQQEG